MDANSNRKSNIGSCDTSFKSSSSPKSNNNCNSLRDDDDSISKIPTDISSNTSPSGSKNSMVDYCIKHFQGADSSSAKPFSRDNDCCDNSLVHRGHAANCSCSGNGCNVHGTVHEHHSCSCIPNKGVMCRGDPPCTYCIHENNRYKSCTCPNCRNVAIYQHYQPKPTKSPAQDNYDISGGLIPAFRQVIGSFGRLVGLFNTNFEVISTSRQSYHAFVQQFNQVRSQFFLVVKTLAAFRLLHLLFARVLKKALSIFGFSFPAHILGWENYAENSWDQCRKMISSSSASSSSISFLMSRWTKLVVYLALAVFGSPFLLLMLSRFAHKHQLHLFGVDLCLEEPVSHNQPLPSTKNIKAIALHDFAPANETELGFSAGDVLVITNTHPIEEYLEWWEAEINGRKGLVPANYFRLQQEE